MHPLEQVGAESATPARVVDGDANDPESNRLGGRLVPELTREQVRYHVPADAFALVHRCSRLVVEPTLACEQCDRDDLAASDECPRGQVRCVEQPRDVVRLGAVVSGDEQSERLLEEGFVRQEGLWIEPSERNVGRVGERVVRAWVLVDERRRERRGDRGPSVEQ